MYLLQKANLATYKSQVGATDEDIEAVAEAADNLQYLQNYFELIDANKKTVAKIKQQVYNGDPDEAVSAFPAFPAAAPPHTLIAGVSELGKKRNRRFKAAEGYTKEIGIALGIDGDAPSIAPGSVKPTAEVFAAQNGYMFSVIVGNRGDSDQWDVEIRRAGSETWTPAKTATGKSVDVTVTPTTPGQPEQLQVRIQLKKKNEDYGQVSDAVSVTVNP
jgi:hypothetical protein